MRYQKFENKTAVPEEPVAAVWPSFQEVLLARQPFELEEEPSGLREELSDLGDVAPATAAPDVPAAVGGLIMGS